MSVSALFNLKIYLHTFLIQLVKEMKKIEYVAPEMEILELKYTQALLNASDDQQAPGTGDNEHEWD